MKEPSTRPSSTGPRLVVPPPTAAHSDEAVPDAAPATGGVSAMLRDPRLALGVLLAAALLGLLAQSWRAQELSSQVGALEGHLASAQRLIERHEMHLQRVQGSVGALLVEVQELDALVHAPPTDAGTAPEPR
ncbi:MAG: hypothetical protein AAEJ53_20610 [Myxococcota bacterium]